MMNERVSSFGGMFGKCFLPFVLGSVMFLPSVFADEVKPSETVSTSETASTAAAYKDVFGVVTHKATGEPAAGVQVSLLYEITSTDEKGEFRFEKVPTTHSTEVSLRVKSKMDLIIGCMTLDVPSRFYPLAAATKDAIAVAIVRPENDEKIELQLEALGPGPVDPFCQKCHQMNPCLETSSYQDVLKTKTDMRGIIVKEDTIEDFKVKALSQGFNEETYRTMRYQDTHPQAMDLTKISISELPQYKGLYQIPAALTLMHTDEDEDNAMVTCDTCHTRHMPTASKYYTIMPYEDDNGLCIECHL